ncbi:PQQ-binding-like beta-propeller repeat protein [Halosimplex sp. TS25]|uniref:PQQ-binding-like beta-propeller repeat protein n=1 Tax=Halosimplex rarum TaxID=3396619 RepID=UPI0039E92630
MLSRQRRALLRALGVAAAGALAGCPGDESGDTDTPDADPTPTDTPAPTPTARPTESPTATATDTETATETETDAPDDETPETDGAEPARPDTGWPLPRGGERNHGHNPEGVTFGAAPTEAWRAEPPAADTDYHDPEYVHPVVADGRVYATGRLVYGPHVAPPERQFLHALDPVTGERVWEYELTDESDGSVAEVSACAARGDRVYVGADDRLHAVDAAEGTAHWTRQLPERVDVVHPTAEGVVLATGWSVRVLESDGERRWDHEFGEHVGARPALGDQYLYVGASGKQLMAFDPATGDRAWMADAMPPEGTDEGGWAVYTVVTVGERVVVRRASGVVYAFDRTGEPVWHDRARGRGLTADGERLYTGRVGGKVVATDPATGERVWEQTVGDRTDDARRGVGPMVAGDDALYGAVADGTLFALRPDDGSVVWTAETDAERLALGSEALYGVGDRDGELRRWTAGGDG